MLRRSIARYADVGLTVDAVNPAWRRAGVRCFMGSDLSPGIRVRSTRRKATYVNHGLGFARSGDQDPAAAVDIKWDRTPGFTVGRSRALRPPPRQVRALLTRLVQVPLSV